MSSLESFDLFFSKVLDDGSIIIVSYDMEYLKSEQFLKDIESKKYSSHLADQLLECRILGEPFVSSMW